MISESLHQPRGIDLGVHIDNSNQLVEQGKPGVLGVTQVKLVGDLHQSGILQQQYQDFTQVGSHRRHCRLGFAPGNRRGRGNHRGWRIVLVLGDTNQFAQVRIHHAAVITLRQGGQQGPHQARQLRPLIHLAHVQPGGEAVKQEGIQ